MTNRPSKLPFSSPVSTTTAPIWSSTRPAAPFASLLRFAAKAIAITCIFLYMTGWVQVQVEFVRRTNPGGSVEKHWPKGTEKEFKAFDSFDASAARASSGDEPSQKQAEPPSPKLDTKQFAPKLEEKLSSSTHEKPISLLEHFQKFHKSPASLSPAVVHEIQSEYVSNLTLAILKSHPKLSSKIVMDVGANNGFPVTRYGLMQNAGTVIAVDPDERNLKVLRKIWVSEGTTYRVVDGAAGKNKGRAKFLFSKSLDTSNCFSTGKNCLDSKSDDVIERFVNVTTVDQVIKEEDVKKGFEQELLLLKSDTQGFELDVISGARDLLRRKRIRHIMFEYSPGLIKEQEANDLLRMLVGHGYACTHTAFEDRKKVKSQVPHFKNRAMKLEDIENFWQFVMSETGPTYGGYTNVYCALTT